MQPVDILNNQYQLLKSSRQVLFAYCETISQVHFVKEIETFGHGSIRNLIVHSANTYIHWLPNFALGSLIPYWDDKQVLSIADIYPIYNQVDQYVNYFLQHYANDLNIEFHHKLPTRPFSVTSTPLTLFTHVLSHEAHHKGQIVSISRHLGYIPVDTDYIRF